MHKKNIFLIIILISFLFISCKKDKNNLYSISISPNSMVGTPAEVFSLQQIKMFQASNSFICSFVSELKKDDINQNLVIAPFYLMNNIILDTLLAPYTDAYSQKYDISMTSPAQMISCINQFNKTVKQIDSSIDIQSKIDSETDSEINISQTLDIKLLYNNVAPNDIDNIFTNFDGTKRRIDFITLSDNINVCINDMEKVCEIPIGNGNYTMMLISPLNQSIKEYIATFDEKKYRFLINSMELRKVNVSFPLGNIFTNDYIVQMPKYKKGDSIVAFPKQLKLNSHFLISQADPTIISSTNMPQQNNGLMQTNDSSPLKYNAPFLLIIRGKNSNLIMLFCICLAIE